MRAMFIEEEFKYTHNRFDSVVIVLYGICISIVTSVLKPKPLMMRVPKLVLYSKHEE